MSARKVEQQPVSWENGTYEIICRLAAVCPGLFIIFAADLEQIDAGRFTRRREGVAKGDSSPRHPMDL
jgi:hypothetical protein